MKASLFTKAVSTVSILATIAVSSPAIAASTPRLAATPATINFDSPSRPTLVFLFAHWCPYCERAAPHFQSTVAAWADRVDFVALTLERDTSRSNSFLQKHGITSPLVENPDFDSAKFKVTGYPNFIWLEPGKPFANLGPLGYTATDFSRALNMQYRWNQYLAPQLPAKVGGLSVVQSKELGVFTASWAEPASKTAISHYEVRISKDGEEPVTHVFGVSALSSVIRIPDAVVDTDYLVVVRAVTALGNGAGSSVWVRYSLPAKQVSCKRGKRLRSFDAKVCPTGWTKVA